MKSWLAEQSSNKFISKLESEFVAVTCLLFYTALCKQPPPRPDVLTQLN